LGKKKGDYSGREVQAKRPLDSKTNERGTIYSLQRAVSLARKKKVKKAKLHPNNSQKSRGARKELN